MTEIFGEYENVSGFHLNPDHAGFEVWVIALIRAKEITLVRSGNHRQRPVLEWDRVNA